ncbi:MAG: leucyl aminopeptidase [Melioribacter sp.]|uniref:leucyl aminopeptidase n=1 Tax=Melioribacter sp. TaxID=2052167 RepID=UPI003BCDF57D
MLFRLKINAKNDEIKFGKNALLLKFFVDTQKLDKQLESFLGLLNLKINPLYKEKFLDKETNEIKFHSSEGDPVAVILKKIKTDREFNSDFFRDYLAGLMIKLKNEPVDSMTLIVPPFKDFEKYFAGEKEFLRSMAEGLQLGNYSFDNYKSTAKKARPFEVNLHYSDNSLLKRVVTDTNYVMNAVFMARDLVNEPAIKLTPLELASRAKKELALPGVKVIVWNKKELEKRKMNAILAVGGASDNPPCMIIIHYKPAKSAKKKIALVGKGVTYDSGGLSIKPTSGMLDMKADMAGGAAVIGAIKAAALLKLPVELIGVVPAVENMIGGKSYKPGDVIISASGKTIEVKDTDAEGRIILADALHYVSGQKPHQIIDFATLTGACVVALGEIAAGLFTENNELAEGLLQASNTTYERLWQMPFWSDYEKMIESEIADVANLGPRWGGAITAGKFLQNFVDPDIPWAHIDIAGPALKHKSRSYTEKYNTGFGVRLIIDYLLYTINNGK